MDRFDRRRQFRAIMNSKITLFVLIFLLFIAGRSTWALYGKNQEAAMKKDFFFRENEGIKDRQEFLKKEIHNLKTDEGVEEILRQKFNIKKEGEEVLVVIDDQESGEEEKSSSLKTRFDEFIVQIKDFFR